MPVLSNIGYLATCREAGGQGEIHPIREAALVWENERILWVGPERELPTRFTEMDHWNAQGKLVIPGLIDCHTHLAFGGWREGEFEQRIAGESYLEIAQSGGGILSTVASTREASSEDLKARCRQILSEMASLGITTVECKSGYGLNRKDEIKQLEVYHSLNEEEDLDLVPTLLAAHTVPPEFASDKEGYLDLLCEELIPEIGEKNLAEFCDVFVEKSAFNAEEARRVLTAGEKAGLRAKLHADQLSDSGGASLAADMGAISADHLECVSNEGVRKMRDAGVIAVALPLASLFTFQKPLDARRLVKAGVPVAVATDFNPGSAPSYHLPLVMTLACTQNRLRPKEVLKGATLYAAKAVQRDSDRCSLEPGKLADFAIIDSPDPNHWLYHFRANACIQTVKRGKIIHGQK